MKYILPAIIIIFFGACDGSSTPTSKIAAPQREAMEKAKKVEQVMHQGVQEMQHQLDESDN